MNLKLFMGIVNFSISLTSIILNLIIFIPVFRLAFITRRSTIYIIAFFNIVSDLCQLSITCFYLSASMIANTYLFTGQRITPLSTFLGGFTMNAWYMECLVQIMMSVNRFTVITLNKNDIFTFNKTMIAFLFVTLTTTISAAFSQYWFPCCIFVADHDLMSYLFISIEGEFSYTNVMIVTYDIVCTSVSSLCYIAVFLSIKKAKTQSSAAQRRSDVRYLVQFIFISIFYICAWVLFEILPHLVPTNEPQWYAMVPLMVILNASSNSIIFLSMNSEVQKMVQNEWLRQKLTKALNRASAIVFVT